MRIGLFFPIAIAGLVMVPADVSAQAVGDEITVTGCLARESGDEDVGFEFDEIAEPHQALDEVDLIPADGVGLDDHVGHIVRVTGFVIPDPDDKDDDDDLDDDDDEDDDEITVRVTRIAHVLEECELDD